MNNVNFNRQQLNEEPASLFQPIIQFYNSLPVITRTWFSISLLTTSLHTIDVLTTTQLIFLWDRILPPHLELWRIITSVSWAGPGTLIDFPVLILLYSMVVIVPRYEIDPHEAGRQRRKHTQSDALLAFLCCSLLIIGTYLLLMETSILHLVIRSFSTDHPSQILQPCFTRTLLHAIITLDSFRHPDTQHNINLFPVPGRYVPLFHLGFGLLMDYRINEILHGIFIGWIYWYLITQDSLMASIMKRKRIIYTPQWIIHLVGEEDAGEENFVFHVVESDASNPTNTERNEYLSLEPGANRLHYAASVGDVTFFQRQIEQVDLILTTANSANEVSAATAPFREQDRNGWQPLHEAARSGHVPILKILLEIDDNQDDNQLSEVRPLRRRGNKLKINVNARTNNGSGCTALWLAEREHGLDSEAAKLLRKVGGLSLSYGDAH